MANASICDRCGTLCTNADKIGFHVQREYCATCTPIIRAYMARVDNLHTTLAQRWTDALARYRADCLDGYPKGLLPDCADQGAVPQEPQADPARSDTVEGAAQSSVPLLNHDQRTHV